MSEEHAEIVTDQGVLRGMIHQPENKIMGAIVMLYGYFSSSRVGPARMYIEIARLLASCGFCIFRFDCLGVGNSNGCFSDVSLRSEITDFRRVCNFALKFTKVPYVTIIGHSIGANLAIYVTAEFKKVKGLLLLSPAVKKLGDVEKIFTPKQLYELETRGWTIRKGLFISSSFTKAVESADVLIIARNIAVPCFLFQGTDDEFYSMEGAIMLSKSFPNGHLIPIRGADHNFFKPESRAILFESIKSVIQKLYK